MFFGFRVGMRMATRSTRSVGRLRGAFNGLGNLSEGQWVAALWLSAVLGFSSGVIWMGVTFVVLAVLGTLALFFGRK